MNPRGGTATRQKDPPVCKVAGVRQGAAGARQSDAARAPGLSPARRGRWPGQVLAAAVPRSAEQAALQQPRAALKRVKRGRARLKKGVTLFFQPLQSWAATPSSRPAPRRVPGGSGAGCWPGAPPCNQWRQRPAATPAASAQPGPA